MGEDLLQFRIEQVAVLTRRAITYDVVKESCKIVMSTIGNILWFLFGGLIGGLAWVLAGCLWCITIIGIPVGLQCFKFASLAFFPFGKEVVYGGGGFSFLVNLIWIIFFGLEMAIGYCILGCLWCITILGIPIGKQCFKMAKLSLMPFGASVV